MIHKKWQIIALLASLLLITDTLHAQDGAPPIITPENAHQIEQVAQWNSGADRVVLLAHNGIHLIGHDRAENVSVWNAGTGITLRTFPITGQNAGALSPDGTQYAAAHYREIDLWSLADETVTRELHVGSNATVDHVAFSPDGSLFAAAGHTVGLDVVPGSPQDTGFAHIWDTTTWSQPIRLELPGDPSSIALNTTNTLLAYANWWGDVFLVEIETGEPLDHWQFAEGPALISFSPTGTQLAISGIMTCTVQLWDVEQGARQLELRDATYHPCEIVAWSPDGALIAGPTTAHDLTIWDTATGDLLAALPTETQVDALVFGSYGLHLYTAGADNVIRVWDVSAGAGEVAR